MDTSLLQTILYIVGVVFGLSMFIAFGVASFSGSENNKDKGLCVGFITLALLLIVAVWAGFNNYRAFESERNVVMNQIVDCKSLVVRTDVNGITNYMVVVDGKEYPVEIKVYDNKEDN